MRIGLVARSSPNLAITLAVFGAVASLVVGAESLGTPMRWVHVLGLFASGMSSGAAIVKIRERLS